VTEKLSSIFYSQQSWGYK